MILSTNRGTEIDSELIYNYFKDLVNRFFKILPMREDNEESLQIYIQSLHAELLGCNQIIEALEFNPLFLSLIGILQFLIDNPNSSITVTKREVFKAISICNKFKAQYAKDGA